MDCERCSAELPGGGNFCSNCGEPRPDEAASGVDQTRPCRDCAEQVQVEAGFCWNCGARSPHIAPAVTGNTVVRKAPPDPSGPRADHDFEWEEDSGGDAPSVGPLEPGGRTMRRGSGTPPVVPGGRTMRRGSGTPPVVPGEPTQPKSVGPGFSPRGPQPAVEGPASPSPDESATSPRKVVSMIAEELGEEAATDPANVPTQEVAEDGSEPLSLEPDVDAAVAQAKNAPKLTKIPEEVAELQFLMRRGFHSEAGEAYRLLLEAHPDHPDLLALGKELEANKPVLPVGPDVSAPPAAPRDCATQTPALEGAGTPVVTTDPSAAKEGLPDITVVTRTPENSGDEDDQGAATPVEPPASPTFVEGTAPPTGGFAVAPAVPRVVQPNVTPRLGIHAPPGSHLPSSESLPTNPRMPVLDIDSTAVSKPAGVRLVMLGKRGEAVCERLLAAGGMIEVGRTPDEPWGDDPHIEPSHARLFVIPGGGLRIEPMGRSGVYRQVDERLAVRDGDEFRVGESLLRYSAQSSGWGAVTCYPMSGTTCSTVPIGGSGLIIGRENADIELPADTFVSGAHCKFSCRDEGLFIEDMGSANGTYSRLRAGEAVPYGSLLLLGQTQFKVRRVTP